MNITIVIDSLKTGGAEILALRLATKLQEQGHFVSFIALGERGNLVKQLEDAAIDCIALEHSEKLSIALMIQLYKLLRKKQSDIIITNHFRQLAHYWLPGIFLKASHYHIEHDNLLYKNSLKFRVLLSIFSTKIQSLIVISDTLRLWFSKNIFFIQKQVISIPNGIDADLFKPPTEKKELKERYNLPQNHFILGTCARLEAVKNLTLMIDIFAAWHNIHPQSSLLLVGDGSLREKLEAQVIERGIEKNVIFAGHQSNIVPWYQVMDTYLLTSDDEGLPLAILEAMACGVPVLSRNVGDIPRLFEQNTLGRIVTGTGISNWVDALEEMQDPDVQEKLGEKGRKEVLKSYSFSRCLKSYIALFNSTKK